MDTYKQNNLVLEPLESRQLLSAVVTGAEVDGDLYEIELTGAGNIANVDLASIALTGTNSSSKLTVRVTEINGDGLVAVGHINTSLSNMGRLMVEGDLGALTAAKLGRLEAVTLGKEAGNTGDFIIDGKVDRIKVTKGVFNVEFTIDGDVGKLVVGDKKDVATDISQSSFEISGDLGRLTLKHSLTANSSIEVSGGIKRVDIGKSIVGSTLSADGDIRKISIGGGVSLGSEINVGGDLRNVKIKKSASDMTMEVGGELRVAKFEDDLIDSEILADSIRVLRIKDDLLDSRIGVTNDLRSMKVDDARGLTLRVGDSTGTIKIRRGLDSSLFSILGDVGIIHIGGDLNRSTIMGGVNIGDDFLLETFDDFHSGATIMKGVIIRGDMIDSSIAAGIRPNGPFFGDGDDTSTNNHVGTARIRKIIVRGEISSTLLPGESYAISADDGIDRIRSRGQEFTGSEGVIIQEF